MSLNYKQNVGEALGFLPHPDYAFEAIPGGVKVTRTHAMKRIRVSMELPTTMDRIERWLTTDGLAIQSALPELNADQREFLLTGVTPEEWDAMFPPEEDDE